MQARVDDVMEPPAVVLDCNDTLATAVRCMLEARATEVYVQNERGEFLGVVPDYELLKARLYDRPGSIPLREVASRDIRVVRVDSPLDAAAAIFRECNRHRIAVVENGRLVGHLSRGSVLKAIESDAVRRCDAEQPSGTTPRFAGCASAIRSRQRASRVNRSAVNDVG